MLEGLILGGLVVIVVCLAKVHNAVMATCRMVERLFCQQEEIKRMLWRSKKVNPDGEGYGYQFGDGSGYGD